MYFLLDGFIRRVLLDVFLTTTNKNNKLIILWFILLYHAKNQHDVILVLSFRANIEIQDLIKVNQDTAFFNVKGLSLGTASLTFTASIEKKGRATSEPKDIQVRHDTTKPQNNNSLERFPIIERRSTWCSLNSLWNLPGRQSE